MKPRHVVLPALLALSLIPQTASAWGYEGHKVVAAIARAYLTPAVRTKVDALLAADTDTLEPHDMLSAATWADSYRRTHRETEQWHFVDLELDKPDLASACFGFPAPAKPASAGPAQDCIVDPLAAFTAELSSPATDPAERIVALKFVLHFVGDIHQPLHTSDNHDHGGNCVVLSLGGPRSTNLHSFWDTHLIEDMGADPQVIADGLRAKITPAQKTSWEHGDPKAWALESFGAAQASVYTINSKPGCDDKSPVNLPAGYEETSKAVAAGQLERAGVRLAWVLNKAFS
jgi:S1/P1 Nuclease